VVQGRRHLAGLFGRQGQEAAECGEAGPAGGGLLGDRVDSARERDDTLIVAAHSRVAGSLSGSGWNRRAAGLYNSCTRTSGLTILKAAASRFSDFSIRFGRASSGESQLPGDSGEPALASADLFAGPTPRDCPGQRVSAFFLSARSRESPAARVRGWTFRIDAGIGQTRAPNP
jgi:hypothetical protein